MIARMQPALCLTIGIQNLFLELSSGGIQASQQRDKKDTGETRGLLENQESKFPDSKTYVASQQYRDYFLIKSFRTLVIENQYSRNLDRARHSAENGPKAQPRHRGTTFLCKEEHQKPAQSPLGRRGKHNQQHGGCTQTLQRKIKWERLGWGIAGT